MNRIRKRKIIRQAIEADGDGSSSRSNSRNDVSSSSIASSPALHNMKKNTTTPTTVYTSHGRPAKRSTTSSGRPMLFSPPRSPSRTPPHTKRKFSRSRSPSTSSARQQQGKRGFPTIKHQASSRSQSPPSRTATNTWRRDVYGHHDKKRGQQRRSRSRSRSGSRTPPNFEEVEVLSVDHDKEGEMGEGKMSYSDSRGDRSTAGGLGQRSTSGGLGRRSMSGGMSDPVVESTALSVRRLQHMCGNQVAIKVDLGPILNGKHRGLIDPTALHLAHLRKSCIIIASCMRR